MLLRFNETSEMITGNNVNTFKYDPSETFQIIFMRGKHFLFEYRSRENFAFVHEIQESNIELKMKLAVKEPFYINSGYFITGAGRIGVEEAMSIFACGPYSDPDICYVACSTHFKRIAFRKPSKTFSFDNLVLRNPIKGLTTFDGHFVSIHRSRYLSTKLIIRLF